MFINSTAETNNELDIHGMVFRCACLQDNRSNYTIKLTYRFYNRLSRKTR